MPRAEVAEWLEALDVAPPPVRTLPIRDVVRDVRVHGPALDLATPMREQHQRFHQRG